MQHTDSIGWVHKALLNYDSVSLKPSKLKMLHIHPTKYPNPKVILTAMQELATLVFQPSIM